MRVGIYGGTFSPVHNGHVAAARAFMEQMWLDILYIIPTGVTPHKIMKGDASARDRLEMCRLAFEGMEGVIVSDLEMRREGKSYTVDTLRELYDPSGRLFFLMGTDMLLTPGGSPRRSFASATPSTSAASRMSAWTNRSWRRSPTIINVSARWSPASLPPPLSCPPATCGMPWRTAIPSRTWSPLPSRATLKKITCIETSESVWNRF